MSEMTYLQRRLAMKNGLLKSTDGKKGSSDDQGTPHSADQPKSGPTPAKGGKPGKSPKKAAPKKMRKVAKKRARQNSKYTKVKKKFLVQNPTCQAGLEGCTGVSTDLHHIGGRTGENLLKVEDFSALCRNCHNIIDRQMSAERAKEIGMKKSRLGKPNKNS
jgi:hypothetical protein